MLNIISRAIVSHRNRGPRKVVSNLMRGLDRLEVPYIVNQALNATNWLWIHDDPVALKKAATLASQAHVIAGPNIYTTPRELPAGLPTSDMLWVYPSSWVENFWNMSGFSHTSTGIWSVGIDTEVFAPNDQKKGQVLVYVKQRSEADIIVVTEALHALQESYRIIRYGSYQEENYRKALGTAKAVIWIGRSESQGIAMMEALAMDIPVLVWDISSFGEWEGCGHDIFTHAELDFKKATAAPYFDAQCGEIVHTATQLEERLPTFFANLGMYTPRNYIVANHTLTQSAQRFLALMRNHFGAEPDTIPPATEALWRNATLSYIVRTRFTDMLRSLIK